MSDAFWGEYNGEPIEGRNSNLPSAQDFAIKADDYKSKGDYHRALENLEYALALDSTLSYARWNLGWCHFLLEEFTRAIEVFSERILQYLERIGYEHEDQ